MIGDFWESDVCSEKGLLLVVDVLLIITLDNLSDPLCNHERSNMTIS